MVLLRLCFPHFSNTGWRTVEWEYTKQVKSLSHRRFVRKLDKVTSMKAKEYLISWYDGKEFCTITGNGSLQDALNILTSRTAPGKPIYFFTFPLVSEDTKMSDFYGQGKPEFLPRDFRDKVLRFLYQQSDRKPRIVDLYCQKCHRTSWNGPRFTCVTCPQAVFCNSCYHPGLHRHPVLMTPPQAEFPCPVLRAVREVAFDQAEPDTSVQPNDSQMEVMKVRQTLLRSSTYSSSGSDDDDNDEYGRGSSSSSNKTSLQSTSRQSSFNESMIIDHALAKMRELGFEQSDETLVKVIVEERGNLARAIDRVTNG